MMGIEVAETCWAYYKSKKSNYPYFLHIRMARRHNSYGKWSYAVQRSSCQAPAILSDFTENWIFRTDFLQYWNPIFHENPSSWSRIVPDGRADGQTDRHAEVNIRFSQ